MTAKSGWQKLTDEERDERAKLNREARMARVDQFDPATRTLVYNYGLNIVQNFHQLGVTKPNHIRHLVEAVLDEFSPTRGSFSQQGIRNTLNKEQPK